ncbi:TipAS antibiotic-recognition domain-containing protein [Nonomuraea sp. K274]|uniref:TipAS antibiotic-recognition domain-containing protein n=1 Tax=Nonomuraea cypriaca TaxID=1187855 RepID=A0A931AJ52_9ACTN|nr:TipAS antibiotic-recognition domain-containing protein [Nonomuraea cypriaca]MBF8192660.1 TipAS antibiotic-recognition domain-containing protein [Nonomuraea cypriaca]
MSANLNLTPEERTELFGDFNPDDHAAEAEQRWGGTDAWAESARRTSSFTKEDWQRFLAEAAEIGGRMAEAMRAGVPADSDRAMDLAEEHRAHITRWCYTCTYEIHRGLGDMYVSDPRFTSGIDQTAPGLAAYYQAAISANATRHNA